MKVESVDDATKIAQGLSALSSAARKQLEAGLVDIIHLYESGDKAERALYYAAAQELFENIVNKYGEAAQAIAYEVLAMQGIPLKSVQPINQTYNAGEIIKEALHKPHGGAGYLSGAVDQAVKRGYRKTIMDNAERWARVPTGAYTCPWCVMLASRGFVYKSEKSAGGHRQWHAYCDCVIIPVSREGEARLLGYDPDKLYELYKKGEGIGERPDRKEAYSVDGKKIDSSTRADISIGRSLGAAAKNYQVRLKDGMRGIITEGTKITGIKVFAGYGTDTELRVKHHLVQNYGGDSEKWQHTRGMAYIDGIGKKSHIRKKLAEIHWFEEPDAKIIIEMEVKRWVEEQE